MFVQIFQKLINKAFAALKSNPENWKTVAESFIKIFDTFNEKLIKIAEENGGKAYEGSFIDPMAWLDGRIVLELFEEHFLTKTKQNEISNEYSMSLDRSKAMGKYFKHYVQKPLMAEICKEVNGVDVKKVADLKKKIEKKGRTLTTKDLNSLKSKHFKDGLAAAGSFWIKNFVKPVGRLLIDYSKEMPKDVENLQCLLNLWRSYRSCETLQTKVPDAWERNFHSAYEAFGSSLASVIINCKEDEGKTKIEILCQLLRKDPSRIDSQFVLTGCEKYNFQIMNLVAWIGGEIPVCNEIKESLDEAKGIVKAQEEWKNAANQGYIQGLSARNGFGY